MSNYKFYDQISLLDENNNELYSFTQGTTIHSSDPKEYVYSTLHWNSEQASVTTKIFQTPSEAKEGKEILKKVYRIDRKTYAINSINMEKELVHHSVSTIVKKSGVDVGMYCGMPSNSFTPIDGINLKVIVEVKEEINE